ncbi:MAG: ATP-dependent DNA helicase RecG [Acidimicrobiales bacterium]
MSDAPGRPLVELAAVGVERLRGVGERRRAALAEMGIDSVLDLLSWFPRRYVDLTRRVDLAELAVGETAAVYGEVVRTRARRTRQGRSMVEVSVGEGPGALDVVFFNQPWRERQLRAGVGALFFGALGEYRGRRQMTNPTVEVVLEPTGRERDPERIGRVVAVYPSGAEGLASWEIAELVDQSLRRAGPLADPLTPARREALGLIERTAAYWGIHRPETLAAASSARRRLAFDELWRLQVASLERRRRLERDAVGVAHPDLVGDLAGGASLVGRFIAGHRFALTGAQRRCAQEILADLAAPRPMHRLLQGDVGAGKTTVALLAVLCAREGGRQSALVAPTEVLAEQHAASLRADLEGLELGDDTVLGGRRALRVGLLTGRTGARERRGVLEALAEGGIDVVVGTHALFEPTVRFCALGLVVIDEQHRFGVAQRAALIEAARERSLEGRDPDLLVMTATPIPRTAALTVFGDLDQSVLDELPDGRRPVETHWLRDDPGPAWARVREEAAAGRRAFVVCPLVEESEKLDAASAVAERDRLAAGPLSGLCVGLVHGQMPGAEKEQAMGALRAGALDVVVATVVIEVGVDVPEATVVVIEDAWRFGLAQLHQLRGRVGRSQWPSWCYLLGEAPSAEAAERLEALVASNDGFALAARDLELRGEGTLLGSRQRGRSDLRLASLVRDADLVEAARGEAIGLVEAGGSALETARAEVRLFVEADDESFLHRS